MLVEVGLMSQQTLVMNLILKNRLLGPILQKEPIMVDLVIH